MAITTLCLADYAQRELVLDPKRSFIVQAPAGSGKTSLLVQRYLALLAWAKVPEEILAITFTRKAQAQMQNKVLKALKEAMSDQNATDDLYSQKTTMLAKAVLERDQKLGWQIQENPTRLKIQTIDALCHNIVQKAPLLSGVIKTSNIVKDIDAHTFYSKAILNLIQNILKNPQSDYYPHLETLLLHLDNDLIKFTDLCISMLKCREQWLPHIVQLKNDHTLRKLLENGLNEINQLNISNCEKTLPKHLASEINALVVGDSWLTRAQLLLTKSGSWRSTVNSAQGFPAPNKGKNKAEQNLYRERKERMQRLLAELQNYEDFRKSLVEITISPPNSYSEQQWQVILALLEFLKVLAAELKVTLSENGVTDHSEISMTADYVLGEPNAPSEVALNFDSNLKHLLIDEFQDTSYAQYRLLEKLTSGWQANDGRTLFIVGDPMQSIYLFRDAEVGLFLKAQQQGIGTIKLEPVTLSTNFRSNKSLVAWVNDNLSTLLPRDADFYQGAIPFSPSVAANKEDTDQNAVTIITIKDGDEKQEADEVVSIIENLKSKPEDSVAILVKTRNNLRNIIPALRAKKIDYQAVELDTLSSSIVIQDLFALTRALSSLVDTIAWLAILRAPWCALTLKDLHAIANGPHQTILENIRAYQTLNLTPDGFNKLQKFAPVIENNILKKHRLSWRDLIESTWLELEGPAVINLEELEHPQIYFDLLDEQQILNLLILEKKLAMLFAPTDPNLKTNLTIMTIHKAKGLEFDHVIIPGLDSNTRHDGQKLLLWQERPCLNGPGSNLILAPIKEASLTSDPIYEYLRLCMVRKNNHESGRLLYVATTRAKKSLYLMQKKERPELDSF